MKRSDFLKSLAAVVGSACAKPPPPAPPVAAPAPTRPAVPVAPVQPRAYKHWAWLSANASAGDEWYKSEFSRMQEAGVSALLIEAFNGSEAFYASTHLPTQGDLLARLVPLAKAAGLEAHAWVWCMPCNVESVVRDSKDWFMVNRQGVSAAEAPPYLPQYRFLCPTRPAARAFIKQRLEELVKYPIDGVHLDTLQYPHVILPEGLRQQYGVEAEEELPQYDYCYCEACRAMFEEQTGIDPMNFNQPSASDAWRQFRYDRLSELVNRDLVPTLRRAGKLASATVLTDWENARQDWANWQLDAAFPMLHHTLYNEDITWIGFQTQESVQRLSGRAPCYSGLLVSHLSPPDLTGAVRMALESGAKGVGLFTGQTMSPTHWEAFRRVTEEAEQAAVQPKSEGG